MEKGLAIIEQTTDGTKAVFFDQESLECARLNLLTKKRLAEAQEAQVKADRKNRKAEAAKARFKAYTTKTFCIIAADCAAVWAVAQAGAADLVHPAIFIPVSLLFLCAACVRLGAWIGRVVKK